MDRWVGIVVILGKLFLTTCLFRLGNQACVER